jgi:multidrug transporter EmrE-like cation transporter
MAFSVVILNVILNVAANVFLKLGMREFAGGAGAGAFLHMVRTPFIYAAVLCYGMGFAVYGLMLTRLNVSVAYPVMTGSIALTLALVSRLWLGEAVGMQQMLGIALIVGGICLLAR